MPPSESAVALAQDEDNGWTLKDLLLAESVDTLRLLLWAKTKDGSKNRNRPKPITRPGRRPAKFGNKPLTLVEMDAWLAAL